MRIWKAIVSGILLFFSINHVYAITTLLVNFPQLVAALENAEDVRGIIHFDNCLITNQKDGDVKEQIIRRLEGATTRVNFTHYLHSRERISGQFRDTVSTSMRVFIEQPSGEFRTLFASLKVFEDNTATLHFEFFDLFDHKRLLDVEWLCDISNGRDDNGLYLYNFP